MSPMELIIEERVRRVKKAKRSVEEERRETVKRWQRLWSQSNKEKWTRKLIPGVPPWYYKAHEEINHFLTQLLTRHGDFNQYLYRIGKIPSAMCQCGSEIETAKRLFLECERRRSERENMKLKIGLDINTDEIEGHMIRTEKQWDAVSEFATRVLKKKMNEARTINA